MRPDGTFNESCNSVCLKSRVKTDIQVLVLSNDVDLYTGPVTTVTRRQSLYNQSPRLILSSMDTK